MNRRLNADERELVFELATKLTGSCQVGEYRRDILVNNVEGRIIETSTASLDGYLALAMTDNREMARLLSALTIHTTEWFRELPHYERIVGWVKEIWQNQRSRSLKVLSLGCSSGEEVYSLALNFAGLKGVLPQFDFQIHGWDIDPISIEKGKRAIYPIGGVSQIPVPFRPYLLLGSGPSEGLFTIDPQLRQRCSFAVHSLDRVASSSIAWDIIICRNVLIYFDPPRVKGLVRSFVQALVPGGMLCLGHSEAIDAHAFGVQGRGHAIYLKSEKPAKVSGATSVPVTPKAKEHQPRHMLVVDDSRSVQTMLEKLFNHAGFIVNCASTPEAASELAVSQKIEFITLEINMPDLDALAWLRQIRRAGCVAPCVIISHENGERACDFFGVMKEGAQDFIPKELLHSAPMEIVSRVRAIADAAVTKRAAEIASSASLAGCAHLRPLSATRTMHRSSFRPQLLLLGASTGGTEALTQLLTSMPQPCPPVLVVQHITASFAQPFAERLASFANLRLGAAQTGTRLQAGYLYMALGSQHISVKRQGPDLILMVGDGSLVNGHRPSIDVLFSSVARLALPSIGVLLTGMGSDGARGLKELHDAGAFTLAQDEASCIVYGMPREAVKLGGVDYQGNLRDLRAMICQYLQTGPSRESAA